MTDNAIIPGDFKSCRPKKSYDFGITNGNLRNRLNFNQLQEK